MNGRTFSQNPRKWGKTGKWHWEVDAVIGTGTKPHKAVLHVTLAVDSEATLTHQTLMDSTKMETLTGTANQSLESVSKAQAMLVV